MICRGLFRFLPGISTGRLPSLIIRPPATGGCGVIWRLGRY
jgi:hypothetical protein